MLTKSAISEAINEQNSTLFEKKIIPRSVPIPKSTNRILILSGIRRCGKSTLMRHHFLKNDNAIYINFEDPRLINFELSDFARLEAIMQEQGKEWLLLDEVQIIDQWEIFARSAHDKGISLVITGSNASLLSRELGTKLTGRYYQIELFPFNFDEFLVFHKSERTLKDFDRYFSLGGFPEFLEEPNSDYHRLLLRDIVTRDIALRRHLTNEKQLLRLAVHLLSNIGKDFSYNSLSKILEIKSVRSVIDYCDYLNESYLLEYIPMYSTSIKKQIANPKKVYAVDSAFAQSNSMSFSKDLGRRLENIVFNKLRYLGESIFYYRNKNRECDFLTKTNEQITRAVQVCWEVNNDNLSREIEGLKAAMRETSTQIGIIITYDQEDDIDGIPLIPAWKWI